MPNLDAPSTPLAEAEEFWHGVGAEALAQYRCASRELCRDPVGLIRGGCQRDSLIALRDEALADAERSVTALERLAAILTRRRIRPLPATFSERVAALTRETEQSLCVHDEALRVAEPSVPLLD